MALNLEFIPFQAVVEKIGLKKEISRNFALFEIMEDGVGKLHVYFVYTFQDKGKMMSISYIIIWLSDFACCDWSIPGP